MADESKGQDGPTPMEDVLMTQLTRDKKKSFDAEFQRVLPEAEQLAGNGDLPGACDALLAVEKKARLGGDIDTLKLACAAIVRLSKASWEALVANVVLLSKRRSQHKSAVTEVVQLATTFLDEAPSDEARVELLTTLRDVTDGKIYVEMERAQLTKLLSQYHEDRGDVAAAADVLHEVHVETFGSMTRKEKAAYIMDQMRLMLLKRDFVRAFILAKKISAEALREEGMEALKVQFYTLMVEYWTHENDTMELFRCYHAIYSTPAVQEDPSQWQPALERAVLFLALSPHGNEQHDMLHRIHTNEQKNLEALPAFRAVLRRFCTDELAPFPFPEAAEVLSAHPVLTADPERSEGWRADLRTRVVQHNVLVLARYYKRARMQRVADLLALSVADAEAAIATMVSSGTVYAKIDRPAGIVSFAKPRSSAEVLSDWSADLSQLLALVETTTHHIAKEKMVHKVAAR